MKRVEILGIEGIGKTTLYGELVICRNKNDTWITVEEAQDRVAYENIIKNKKKSLKYLFAAIFLKIKINRWVLNHLCDDILLPPQENNFLNLNKTYNRFLNLILDHYAASDTPPQIRFIRITRLYNTMIKLLYLDNDKNPDVFLCDSSTISMAGLLILNQENRQDEQMVKAFFQQMPIPAGIIYCYLDQKEAIHRILERKNNEIIAIAHRNINNFKEIVDEEKLLNIVKYQDFSALTGLKILKNRGVKVLEIDMKNPLNKNIEKISQFLGELNEISDFT